MDKSFRTSLKAVLAGLLVLGVAYILYLVMPIIALLLVSTLIVIAMEHPIKFFMRQTVANRKLARSYAVLFAYALLVLSVSSIVTLGVPSVLTQAQKLLPKIGYFFQKVPPNNILELNLATVLENISSVTGLSQNIFTATYSVFSNFFTILSVLIISIYTSLDWEKIKRHFFRLFDGELKHELEETVDEIEVSVGHWIKGQITLMTVVGLLSYLGLVILDIGSPVALALFSGLFEVVPVIGPVFSAVLAFIVGFSESPAKGIAAIALFTAIQQLENNLLVPKIMNKVSGFSPLVIIIALLVGNTLFGIVGAIVAVPTMMIGVIIVKKIIANTPHIQE